MVDIATIGILQERAVDDAGSISSQLEFALTSRITIEQAKGIVAERAGTSVDDAFAAIRGYVRRHQLRLHATAQQIVAGTVDVDASEQSPKD
jgi:AmiR/NasT family two-component response regulator